MKAISGFMNAIHWSELLMLQNFVAATKGVLLLRVRGGDRDMGDPTFFSRASLSKLDDFLWIYVD